MKDFYPFDDFKPDFVNKEGIKWWRIDDMSDKLKKAGIKNRAYHILKKDGKKYRVIIDDKGVLYETTSIESLANRVDIIILSKS